MSSETTLFPGIPMATWGASLLVVLFVALSHALLRWWMRRRYHHEASRTEAEARLPGIRHWVARSLVDLVAPVALILWVHGLHFALSALLRELPYPAAARYGLPALDGLRGVATVLALMWLLARVGRAIESRLVRRASRTDTRSDDLFLPIIGAAIRLLLPLLAIILGAPALAVPERLQAVFSNAVSIVLIGTFAYVLYRLVDATCSLVLARHRVDVPDNREARAIHTQVTVLRKVALAVICIFAFAAILMVFEPVRQLGTAILASAGVAGIVVGFAAQRSIATLLAGFQIALTQPIRIDDVVIVENEWGRIEEITLTYVVVNIWDLRRLVVPITYFLEKPFQNWTRTSADLLAYVFLYVDYGVPLDRVREKLTAILEASPLWDRKVNVLQVTDTTEHSVQLRALASARNASVAWDLRCEIREKLLVFLQQEYPESLPRLRIWQDAASPSTEVTPA
jgi:small-conductance mechanosensitive channel